MINKCPACGYNFTKQYNASVEIIQLVNERDKRLKELLKKIAVLINKHVPSSSRKSYFQFLYSIKDIDSAVVTWAIENFNQKRHYLNGKGFSYLRTIFESNF